MALIVLGLGTVIVVALVLYLGAGLKMIRQRRAEGERTRPVLMLLCVPVLAVVLFNR